MTLQVHQSDPRELYSIEQAATQLGVPRRLIVLCCKYGYVSASVGPLPDGWYFDHEALGAVRRIAALRVLCGGSFAGVHRILELESEVNRLRTELRFWRR